jgi:glycosyltransferase involved in cell wall biosynthesis
MRHEVQANADTVEPHAAPRISVVVATHNRAEELERMLAGLATQERRPDEVIVVDDGSTDSTAAVLERHDGDSRLPLRVIRRPVAAGPATAREDGWRAAGGDLIAFTDDDCMPGPGWLTEAEHAWDRRADIFVQGRTEPEEEHPGPFSRSLRVEHLNAAFPTCNMLYPRELLERVGGFDTETYGLEPGGEDCDLAWRAIEAGARPVFAADAVVRHAVTHPGPLGKLQIAARWTTPMTAYARHPGLRKAQFIHWIFWKDIHYLFVRALIGFALPTRWSALRNWLMYPYLKNVWARGRLEGGGPFLAPYFMLHDLIEVWAVARAGIRTRTPML